MAAPAASTNVNAIHGLRRRSVCTDKKDEGEEEDKVEEEREDDAGEPEQKIRRKVGRPKACDRNRMINLKGRKRKLESKLSGLKRSRMSEHSMIHYEAEPLRRSKREKRLVFATLNVRQIDKQILNPGPAYQDMDLSEDELDPYEKLLSPCRNTRHSARVTRSKISSIGEKSGTGKQTQKDRAGAKEEKCSDAEVVGDEEVEEAEDQSEEEEDEDGEEEEGGYYNLRKRQPVIYHIQPVERVVQSSSPPNKKSRKRGRTRHSSFHSNSMAYQTSQTRGKTSRKRQAHRDSSTSSSDSDSDEARFRRRKGRSMAKSRMQCRPMNFVPEDMSHGVLRDRIRIGASLADINPMNIDQSVTFESIGGLKCHIRALKEMIIFPFLYPEVFERFQIRPPRGVLFHGPPGCGKTLVARVLANECSKGDKKVAFFMRKGADCLSKWVGESERQLRLLFDQAYQYRPSIIFFDEIDGLAPIRSSRQDQIHSSIVSTLLALMDGLDSRGEVVVIGATNRIDSIDPALRRPGRFDRELIFPLPSRDDRRSILTIHTRAWNPKLKSEFISELADNTVGYCGADLSALCTEASLFALRRRYPQIYNTTDKLVLDTSKIRISSTDFQNALKAIIPTAQRSDSSVARSIPAHMQTLFLPSLKSLLSLVCFVFSPSWKAVESASCHIEVLLKKELALFSKIDQRVEELQSPVLSSQLNASLPIDASSTNNISCGTESMDMAMRYSNTLCDRSPKSGRNTQPHKIFSRRGSLSNSVGGNRLSGEVYEAVTVNGSRGLVSSVPNRVSTPKSPLATKKKKAQTETPSPQSFTHLHQREQALSSNIGKVFFDLTELSFDGVDLDGSGQCYREDSILEECEHKGRRSSSERRSTSRTPFVELTHYLGVSSHPHAPPSVYHPRLVLCGQEGMGQSSYLGPALIHALEDLPVKTMDLLNVFGSSTRSPEEACTQILREATRTTPSILFLPRLDSWWNVTSEAFQVTLLSSFSSLPPSTPLLTLATAECPWDELPENLKTIFKDVGCHSFTVPAPSLKQRKQFFYQVLLEMPLYPPPPMPRMLSEVVLEELPVASPPQPRELNKEEWSKISRQREAGLRELRMFLRDATNKLLAERKLKEFGKPVNPEEVPDYHDIITTPMDLGTIMKKIDEHCYNTPKQWVSDIEQISRNALEYNPEHDSESRLLRHRARALQDMAHSFLDHELSEAFEKQCEEIEETYQRFSAYQKAGSPSRGTTGDGLPIKTGADADASWGSGIYDVPRRSLRQLGLKPVEAGFPYYSPAKPRGSGKYSSKVGEEDEECSVRSHSSSKGNNSIGGGSGSEREQAESSMSVDESSNNSFHDCAQQPPPQNGRSSSIGRQDPVPRLSNMNVRRQLIGPCDSINMNNVNRKLKRPNSLPPELARGNQVRGKINTEVNRISRNTNSVRKGVNALVDMSTPKKQQKLSIELDENHTSDAGVDEREELSNMHPGNSSRWCCSEVDRDLGRARASPQAHRVVIDCRGLLEVYKMVVRGTEECSIEKMEQLHSTFEQLVFRHRMHWEREALLMDLRLATDLFFQ